MSNIFHTDSPLMQALSKFSNWILVNILTVILCIPIITVGAAVTALYDSVIRIERDDRTSMIKSYFRAFKENFKKATILWLILLGTGLALLLVIWFYWVNEVPGEKYLVPFTLVVGAFWLMVSSWVFPLQAQFENPVKRTLNNAILGTLGYMPRTALMAVVNILPWAALYNRTNLFLYLLPFWTMLWFSLAAYINLRILKKVLQQFLESPEEVEA